MRTGPAEAWANEFVDNHLTAPGGFGTFAAFVARMDETFTDRASEKRARDQLEHLTQSKMTVDEYFNRFETLTREATLTSDRERIRLLEMGVHPTTINAIYASGVVPNLYDDYKTRILQFGRLQEQRREQLALTKAATTTRPTPVAHHQQQHPPHRPAPSAPHAHKTPSGTVFHGAGAPMDVDKVRTTNRCFGCGEIGHFRNACPHSDKRKVNLRAFVTEELTAEEREELLMALAGPMGTVEEGESDFV
jgi:hypothetical protein